MTESLAQTHERLSDPHRQRRIAVNEPLARVFADLVANADVTHLGSFLWTLPQPSRKSLVRAANLMSERRESILRSYLFVEERALEIAASYLRQSAQDTVALDAKARAALLRDLSSATGRVLALLCRAESDDQTFFRLMRSAGGRAPAPPPSHFAWPIKQLQERADRALQLRNKHGRPANISLHIFVQQLCGLYEDVTGKPVTHNTHEGGVATSFPRSSAGRFIIEVAKQIDPRITPQQVSSILKGLVSRRSRQKATRKNSSPRSPI